MRRTIFATITCACGKRRVISKSEASTYYAAARLLLAEGWYDLGHVFQCPDCRGHYEPDDLPF